MTAAVQRTRRTLVAAAVLLAASLGAVPVQAQPQEGAPVRLVVPFGAGTTTDTVGRILGESLPRTCTSR